MRIIQIKYGRQKYHAKTILCAQDRSPCNSADNDQRPHDPGSESFFIFQHIKEIQHQQADRHGKQGILAGQVRDLHGHRQIVGQLADDCKCQHPQQIFFIVRGIAKPFHQKERKNRHRQSSKELQDGACPREHHQMGIRFHGRRKTLLRIFI